MCMPSAPSYTPPPPPPPVVEKKPVQQAPVNPESTAAGKGKKPLTRKDLTVDLNTGGGASAGQGLNIPS